MSDQCEARCLQAAVGATQREDEWSLSFFPWPLRGPACPSLTHTLRWLSHTLFDRWRRGDSDGRVWMIPSTPQRPGNEFLAIISPSLPPVPLTLDPCFPFQSLPLCLALSLSPPPLFAHPLSYDNLFWLLTSCLSLIQYSGFSAIQPWPITTLHLAFPWISWRSYHLVSRQISCNQAMQYLP